MVSSTAAKYARAFAEVAHERGLAEAARRELLGFATLMETNEELRETLRNPGLPLKVKQEIVRQIADKASFPDIVLNFLLLLIERNRLGQLAGIVEAYEGVLDERAGVSRIEVFSAHSLPEEARRRLVGVMKKLTGGEVRLTYFVDEGLIGGVKLRMGSIVLDGSVRTELENLGAS